MTPTPMIIRKLDKLNNECYFRWYEFWHKNQRPVVVRAEEIAVVEQDGVYGAGIMVQRIPDSSCVMFSFITRNPFCDREFSDQAVDFLIKNLPGLAKKLGYEYFVSLVGEESAKARYIKCGMSLSDKPLSMFWGKT